MKPTLVFSLLLLTPAVEAQPFQDFCFRAATGNVQTAAIPIEERRKSVPGRRVSGFRTPSARVYRLLVGGGFWLLSHTAGTEGAWPTLALVERKRVGK
jgi:hypothetical protein